MKPAGENISVTVILALGLTQIIGYGTLFYSFSIMAPAMAADFSWSSEWIFGIFSGSLLIGGLSAPWSGRWIDRFGAGRMMTGGSVAAAAALAACATAPDRSVFILAQLAIGMASTVVLYSAAFALLVQIGPQSAQRNITYLTLMAGLASTIFWPITTALHVHLSWRQVYLVFAALNLFVCLPIHAWLWRSLRRSRPTDSAMPLRPVEGSLPPSARGQGFLWMAAGFALESFVNAAVLVHMVPLLGGLGLGGMAVLVGTVFGPAQVLSRFTNMMLGGDLAPLTLAALSAVLMTAAIALLGLTAPVFAGAVAFAVIFGFGSGLSSIVQGTLPLALFGSDGYGRRQGKLLAVRLIVSSSAPFAFAFMMAAIGVVPAMAIIVGLGVLAVFAFIAIGRLAAGRS